MKKEINIIPNYSLGTVVAAFHKPESTRKFRSVVNEPNSNFIRYPDFRFFGISIPRGRHPLIKNRHFNTLVPINYCKLNEIAGHRPIIILFIAIRE